MTEGQNSIEVQSQMQEQIGVVGIRPPKQLVAKHKEKLDSTV